ncbi:MAG: thioredoxin family protein [Ignavibacteria bacterium]|nr:thioredoxin family protein [Ignavibacteria bacterium]
MYTFTKEIFDKAYGYRDYKKLLDGLLRLGKTTGENRNQARVRYTNLNFQRMNRIEKTTTLTEELKHELDSLRELQNWIVITEGWCGDAANIVPVLFRISEYTDKINYKLVLRDDNPQIMNEYLTNGTKSIPMLIVLDNNYKELANWGPRPEPLKEYILTEKKKDGYDDDELKKNINLWYFNDKTTAIQSEITELLNRIKQKKDTK